MAYVALFFPIIIPVALALYGLDLILGSVLPENVIAVCEQIFGFFFH